MAKFKMKKLPKKPKASASVATMENYLKKVADIKKYNQGVASQKKKHADLKKKVSAVSGTDVLPGSRSSISAPRKRKSSGGKKKAAKKSKRKR